MRLETDHGGHRLIAKHYALTFPADRPFVYIEGADGTRIAELFVLSGVHPIDGRDDTVSIEPWQVRQGPEEVEFCLRAASSAWDAKTCLLYTSDDADDPRCVVLCARRTLTTK